MQAKIEDCTVTTKVINDAYYTYYIKDDQLVAKCVKTAHTEEWFNADGKKHRDDGPAEIYYTNNQKVREFWYFDGKLHRDGQPAIIYYKDGQNTYEFWYRDGKHHRDDGPAIISYEDGKKIIESWFRDSKLDGNVLAYVSLIDINMYLRIYVPGRKINSLDGFRNAVKGPLALELMRPLPIPIRDAIYEHYCYQ